MRREGDTHGTMCAARVAANLPTLVPPYVCTSQRAAGSIEFWWRFGGVRGGGVPGADDEVDGEGEGGDGDEGDEGDEGEGGEGEEEGEEGEGEKEGEGAGRALMAGGDRRLW